MLIDRGKFEIERDALSSRYTLILKPFVRTFIGKHDLSFALARFISIRDLLEVYFLFAMR